MLIIKYACSSAPDALFVFSLKAEYDLIKGGLCGKRRKRDRHRCGRPQIFSFVVWVSNHVRYAG